jgi:hypothetical protein
VTCTSTAACAWRSADGTRRSAARKVGRNARGWITGKVKEGEGRKRTWDLEEAVKEEGEGGEGARTAGAQRAGSISH